MSLDPSHAQPGASSRDGDPLPRLQRRLLARIRRMMGPEAREQLESGDVLQSVNAELLAAPEAGQVGDEALLPWMTQVARNKIVDEVRRRRERPESRLGGEPDARSQASPATRMTDVELLRALGEALACLEPERRRTVLLRIEEDLSFVAIGTALGRTEEAARKLYHRALVDLGQHLALRKLGPEARSAG